ncbi:MAG TPA: efflux RND transporter permease subunit, partial [Alphaproteobacteria bacterium]|nr:efflux RND transporter permease subunit [Alphaproteobacteria bacterium]
TVVDDYADNVLAQQLSQISGVGFVGIGGEQKPAVRVQVDPAKLASMGLSLEDVRNVIANATVDAPKGSIDGLHQNFTIYNNDQLLAADKWNDVIIAYRTGSPVRIRDIGQAIDGPENTKLAGTLNGVKRGIVLIITKQPGANVIDTVDRILAQLSQLRTAVPPAIDIEVLANRTQTIRASVADVQFTLILTVALVVMVIFLFLRNFWATVIPGITVPLSLVATFAVMYLIGYSLDNLSLMALTIAAGFVVDDAIVMIENIIRHVEDGIRPLEAAIKGAREIGFTIISISVSLIAVFIPLLLMRGIIGRLFHEFAITVTIAIAVSAIVSLTLTPMMCARFVRAEHGRAHGRLYMLSERFFDGMLAGYRRCLDWVMLHRRITLGVFIATVVATGYLYSVIPKGFFPQQDTGFIFGVTDAAQSVSFAEMSRLQLQIADIVRADPDVAAFASFVGAGGATQTINNGRFAINLKLKNERTASAYDVINRLRPKIAAVPGIVLYMQVAQDLNVGGRLSRTQFQYTLQDASLDELNEWAPKLFAKLKALPELQDVASDQQTNATTVSMEIDRSQASRFGILPQAIDDTLYDAFGQRQVTQYFTQLNAYHVILEVDPSFQVRTDTLEKIYLTSPITGQQVPLSTFVKYDTLPVTYLSINHQGQFPAVTISFNLSPGTALGQAVAAIQSVEREAGKPGTLIGTFQGSAQAFQTSLATQPYLIAAAIVVIYIILGMLYESYIHPLTILSTLPSAGMGALLMLMIFHYDLSVIALIGIILLIGIVKKNAIMMIDFALAAERNEGMAPEQSIYQACLLRFRPIMMTTMAALLGGVPLMLGAGTGSEIRRPLGYAIVGGLILSQMLTLFTTPVIYLYLGHLQARLQGRKRAVISTATAVREGTQAAE